MRVADVLSRGHMRRCLDTFIEGLQSLIALTTPNLRDACLNRVIGILLVLVEARLEVGDAEDRLKCCVDPTGSVLVAKSEHSLLLEG